MSASMSVTPTPEISTRTGFDAGCSVFCDYRGMKVSVPSSRHLLCPSFSVAIPDAISTMSKVKELWKTNQAQCISMIERLDKRLDALEISENLRIEGKYQEDWVEAMKLAAFPPAALAGSPAALYAIGRLLLKGRISNELLQNQGMSIDPMEYLKKAIEAGHSTAQAYYGGELIARGDSSGKEFLTRAVNDKNVWGYFFLGLYCQATDGKLARNCFKEAADIGFVPAQYEYARILLEDGHLRDALHYFEQASAKGHHEAYKEISGIRDKLLR